jgi:putative phosphoribosyl transferase
MSGLGPADEVEPQDEGVTRFRNRHEAGRALARPLSAYAHREGTVVLGLPRGGVIVAVAAAEALGLPVGVWAARKLCVPGDDELAMGAIARNGIVVLRPDVLQEAGVSGAALDEAILRARDELRDEEHVRSTGPVDVHGRVVIVVDDGLATGATMQAAISSLRRCEPAAVVAAVPVGSRTASEELLGDVDELVCLATPEPFEAVAQGYEDFTPVSDDEVRAALARVQEPDRAADTTGDAISP